MELQSNQSKQNFKIYKTVLELLKARGYVVPDEKQKITFEEFQVKVRQRSNERDLFCMLDQTQQGAQTAIAVFFNFRKEKITQSYISDMIKTAQKYVKNFFIVVNCLGKNSVMNIDKSVMSMVSDLSRSSDKDKMRFEFFKDEDLLFNILDHDLVPKHKVMKDYEKDELLKKYKVKQTQLPKILTTDPVARFLGLRRGDVVKIIRKSQTAGTYTTYRIAI